RPDGTALATPGGERPWPINPREDRVIEDIAGNDAVRLPHAVTVVIPAFNEGAHVADQVREVERVLATTGWTYEIIVVDDGSRDNTAEEADRTGALVLRRL